MTDSGRTYHGHKPASEPCGNGPRSRDNSFERFCRVLLEIMRTRSGRRKIALFSDYLSSLGDEDDIDRAVRFVGEGAFSTISGRRASVGHRTVALTAASFCDVDYDKVFRPCRTATGSASETIEKLMANLPAAIEKRQPAGITLAELEQIFGSLAGAGRREEKQRLLTDAWKRMSPPEIRFMIRIMSQGSLRIGFELRSILSAIARACGTDADEVRRVHMLSGSIGHAALLAFRNDLSSASFQMYQPVAFMLASPLESRSLSKPEDYVAEEKFDGMRAQAHIGPDKAMLFSRDLNDITGTFPDAAAQLIRSRLKLSSGSMVLDGELCVFKDGQIQPFRQLQKRMGVKKPGAKLLDEHPVVFIAYDLLFLDNDPVLELPLPERRTRLETLCGRTGIPFSRQIPVSSGQDIERLFRKAIENGNEGLMLKHRKSRYEYGQRNKSWLKVKEPRGTLDTVIMYAHAGSGKRGGTYSDFTLGIRVADDERYEEEFIPIGKAYSGYTDAELKKLNSRIRELAVERFGPTLSLKPGIIVEVEFDDIQINKRTKAGYTLRLPRFKAIRWDLSPADTDTLADVEHRYQKRAGKTGDKTSGSPAVHWPDIESS